MEPVEIPTQVLLPSRRSRIGASAIAVASVLALALSRGHVRVSTDLSVETTIGCVGGFSLGIASALEQYRTKISPWFVVGGLLYSLGAALVVSLVVEARHEQHVRGSSVLWVGGWAGLLFALTFWLIVAVMLVRAHRRERRP